MSPTDKPDLKELVKRLTNLLITTQKGLGENATADDQAAAFSIWCKLLTDLVEHLEQVNSAISDLEKQTITVTIPKERLEEFLKQEAELLKNLNIDDQQVKQALKLLTADKKSGDSQNLQANAGEAIESLRQYKELVCAIEKQNRKGLRASGELLETCYDGGIATLLIAGDLLALPFAAAGNIGAILLTIASVGSGGSILRKVVKKGLEFFQRDRARHTQEELKKRGGGPKVKKK